jgi:hypothetical protein
MDNGKLVGRPIGFWERMKLEIEERGNKPKPNERGFGQYIEYILVLSAECFLSKGELNIGNRGKCQINH